MRLKKASLTFAACSLCLVSCVTANASGITVGSDYFMKVSSYASGEQNGGNPNYYVGLTTITLYADNGGVEGAEVAQTSEAFCIDIFDQIHTPQTYVVQAQGVGTSYDSALYPTTTSGLSAYLGSTYYNDDTSVTSNNDALATKLAYDSVLGAEFNGNDANDTNIQEAIWDEGGGSFHLNTTASNAATAAEHLVNTSSPYKSTDIAFLELNGDGQSFMASIPVNATPEPSTLLLLGSGLLGAAVVLRRKQRVA